VTLSVASWRTTELGNPGRRRKHHCELYIHIQDVRLRKRANE